MQPQIKSIPAKKVLGKHLRMSVVNDRTFELFSRFMKQRKEIMNNVDTDLICMQVYDPIADFRNFTINTEFEKWAAVEVLDFDIIPEGMEMHTIEGGLYAVFIHYGPPQTYGQTTYPMIFHQWLPSSEYVLDQRTHFMVMGAKYNPTSADSEEEIWVPVRGK